MGGYILSPSVHRTIKELEMIRCNMCGWEGGELDLLRCDCSEDGGRCDGCPDCETDHYLMDLDMEEVPNV